MNDQRYTLLHLSEVFGKTKQTIRRHIAKLNLKSINRDTRKYSNQPLEYDYQTYLALAREFGLASTYTQEYEEIELTASDVIYLCEKRYPRFQIKEIELERKSGGYLYSIEGFDEEKNYEIEMDPVSGMMLKIEEEISPQVYWKITQEQTDQVGILVEKILKEAGNNSRLCEWSLENEDGIPKLDIEVKLENSEIVDYEYNFITKEIVKK